MQRTVTNPLASAITDSTSSLSLATVQAAQLLRPYPQFTGVNAAVAPAGHSTCHATEVKAERRFAQGVALLFNRTHSKTLDNVGGIAGSFGAASGFNNDPQGISTRRPSWCSAGGHLDHVERLRHDRPETRPTRRAWCSSRCGWHSDGWGRPARQKPGCGQKARPTRYRTLFSV